MVTCTSKWKYMIVLKSKESVKGIPSAYWYIKSIF